MSRELASGTVIKIQDDNLWEIITRDLFEPKDRHHLWRLGIIDRFAELSENDLDKNCRDWTLAGTEWLQQIAVDIRAAISLYSPDKWDPRTAQDFINLLALTLQSFQGQQKCLGKIKKHFENLKTSDQHMMSDPQVICKEFNKWCTCVNNNLAGGKTVIGIFAGYRSG